MSRGWLLAGVALAVSALALGGCTSMKRALGMEKVMPDEFAVTTPAPLALPPDYALRPPQPGERRPQEVSTTEEARQTVFRAGANEPVLPAAAGVRTAGETALLREAGAANTPGDIRRLVNNDADRAGDYSQNFVDKLLFWKQENGPGSPNEVINPTQESERIAAEKAAGHPLDSGPPTALTGPPIIERNDQKSWWDYLL